MRGAQLMLVEVPSNAIYTPACTLYGPLMDVSAQKKERKARISNLKKTIKMKEGANKKTISTRKELYYE